MTPPALPLILIADDRGPIRRGFAHLLAEAGYQALQASDGEEALDLLRKHRVDMVLLDVAMPNLDAWGVLDALGFPDQPRHHRIMLMDAEPAREDIADRAAQYGVRVVEKFAPTVLSVVKAF